MLLTLAQVIILAILQGVTELFPVSSLGHAVVLPALLVWPFDPKGPGLLPFLVILHLGTAAALLLFYWREWLGLASGLVGIGGKAAQGAALRLSLLLIVGTVPAAAAGFALNKIFRELFAVPALAALFLVVNGIILFIGDRRHRLRATGLQAGAGKTIETLTVADALIIGVAQTAALIPGISRSGATIVTGLARKLTPDAAAHFSFLLATPIIGGAAVLEVPKLLKGIHEGRVDHTYLTYSLIGGAVAAVAALISVAFLTRYFRMTEVKMMRPFALYCAIAGIAAFAWLQLR
jgi:undecaprenyl-diphosphatase